MSETKHTPGPWEVAIRKLNGFCIGFHIVDQISGSTRPIAECDDERVTRNYPAAELEANARLIAAAPELLEALKAIMNGQIGGNPDIDAPRFQAARAAIAKAEGAA